MMDLNSFIWVSKKEIGILGGAKFSVAANPTIANNSLTSDVQGTLGGGGGFADCYFQPFILGWKKKRADIRAIYGFLAPTGRFDAGASNNVGNGYWVNGPSAGETFYLTRTKRLLSLPSRCMSFTALSGTPTYTRARLLTSTIR